ncbi:hypothetical protein MLD38_019623 [Melastoma candidum]|uniref:Uncharacterized protein n=1 Tax=Melastoma candidum TaxID=119954 RepID=A0ACB9QZH0_9MYRT|nr:hypothetical protein MLD38_019623 [Melastoma candidum]
MNPNFPSSSVTLSSYSSTPKKIVVLRSSDGVSFEVEEEAALLFQTIKDGMEDCWVEGGLPLPTINRQILSLVIDYCKKHAAASASSEDLDSWDADFVKVEQNTLFDIILAANYLNIRGYWIWLARRWPT